MTHATWTIIAAVAAVAALCVAIATHLKVNATHALQAVLVARAIKEAEARGAEQSAELAARADRAIRRAEDHLGGEDQ